MTLRDYQIEAIEKIFAAYARGVRSQLMAMATGAGKTVVFASLVSKRPGRALVLAHRDRLIQQAASKLGAVMPWSELGIVMAEQNRMHARCVVASVQTLARERRLAVLPKFDTVIVDECHRSAAKTYQRILAHVRHPETLLLGVTATPSRSDGIGLDKIYDEIVYQVGILDLIERGYLVPLRGQRITIEADFSKLHTKTNTDGVNDYRQDEVCELMDKANWYVKASEGWEKYAGDRRTIAFVPRVAMAHRLAEHLRGHGVRAAALDGTTPQHVQRQALSAFERGEIQFLSSCDLLTEGVDLPSANCALFARPTKSQIVYCLDNETEILTHRGWRSALTVLPTDKVASFHPDTEDISFAPYLAIVRRPLEKDEFFVSLQGQSSDIRVTNNHRMLYDNHRRKGWKFKTAENLASLRNIAHIPVAGHFDAPGAPLTDDELRFIGWVMTDGSINKIQNQIIITQGMHQPWLEKIQECIDGAGLAHRRAVRVRQSKFTSNSDACTWTISHGDPRKGRPGTGWAKLEPYLSKDFSERLLWEMSEAQFDVLIEAIHLGDGAKQNGQYWTRRSYHIYSGNKTFIERLQIAAILRGYRANLSIHRRNPYFYALHLKKQNWIRVGGGHGDRPAWQKEEVRNGTCWCVETKVGTILTRRNGKVAIMGNSQAIGRITRLSPETGKIDGLVLDMVGATNRFDLVTLAGLFGLRSLKDGEEVCSAVKREKKEDEEAAAEALDLPEMAEGKVVGREVNLFGGRQIQKRGIFEWQINTDAKRSKLHAGGHTFEIWRENGSGWYGFADMHWRGTLNGRTTNYLEARARIEEEARRLLFGDRDAPWRSAPASPKQVELLTRFRIPIRADITKGEASDLLDAKFKKARAAA